MQKYRRPQCPICLRPVRRPNMLLRYHVRYEPPIVILACRYCNYVEYLLRNKKSVVDATRAFLVTRYMLRFGIQL